MWGNCDSVTTFLARLLSVYRPLRCGKLSFGYVSHWFSVNSTAGSLRPILGWWGRWNAISLSGPILPAFRPSQDNGGDGCCLLVWVFTTSFQTLLDNGGDGMLSPCLGLYHLLSGLRRMMGEMDAVSLSGSILPAFRPCWILGEMGAVSLSGPLLPAFRPSQDNGGDGCCLLVWVSTTSLQTLLDNVGDGCCLLISSPVFTMAF